MKKTISVIKILIVFHIHQLFLFLIEDVNLDKRSSACMHYNMSHSNLI